MTPTKIIQSGPEPQSNWQDPDDVPDLSTPEFQAIFDKVPVIIGGKPKAASDAQTDEKAPKAP